MAVIAACRSDDIYHQASWHSLNSYPVQSRYMQSLLYPSTFWEPTIVSWLQVVHYPAPEHRTAALAHQAAGLYLALYFVPHVLHRDSGLMRTLVDRYSVVRSLLSIAAASCI